MADASICAERDAALAAVQAVRDYLDETTDVSPPMLMRKSILERLGTVRSSG